jgi:hypothetical protein
MIDLPHIPPNKTRYGGMTVNERLVESGLIDRFDEAARKRDRAGIIEVLASVELADQAEHIADALLANPGKYGF